MEGKVSKAFVLNYELDILNKRIRLNGFEEQDLKDLVAKLSESKEFLSQMLLKDIIETAITQMRVMAWTGMDIKEWLKSVGYSGE
ncbi:hypothetical protein [Fervidobacterium thailandense]|uniref:Uncharacterized protein n=1 Tax=Fervidobacterium thailandense TaxID=1008305 RepID=A0A1E3G4L6_9BACT|nr:hypothetical protein [Fervidobacterium thailandense]ODN31226.1 hypothetical protein A4H02_00110 [Fervidobacterium thailandense]